MNSKDTRKQYGIKLEIYLYILFSILLVTSIFNLLNLFLGLSLLLFLITLRFRLKNYKTEFYYIFQITIIILLGLILAVCYLFKSIYLNSLSSYMIFYSFLAFYAFLIILSIHYYQKGRPLFK